MLHRLAAPAHRLRIGIESLLRRLQQMLVLPSGDAPFAAGRAITFERTILTRGRPTQHIRAQESPLHYDASMSGPALNAVVTDLDSADFVSFGGPINF